MNNADLNNKIKKMLDKAITTEIKPVQFRNKKTGEVKTQIDIFELGDYEKVGERKPKPKKPNPATAKFSEMIQYQIDLQNWKRERGFY